MAEPDTFNRLDHFDASEFVYPEMMDPVLLALIDELRARCGFPLRVTSDGRTEADMHAIYGPEPGWPTWLKQKGSPHQRGRAVDLVPLADSEAERDVRRAKVFSEAFQMHERGTWPRLGLEFADRHIHVDNDDVLRRPHFWPGSSR